MYCEILSPHFDGSLNAKSVLIYRLSVCCAYVFHRNEKVHFIVKEGDILCHLCVADKNLILR